MLKELMISVDELEIRAAVLENRTVVELHYERRDSPTTVGNVYLGATREVLAGMEAAFIDIGLDRNAFLYFGNHQGSSDHATTEGPVGAFRRGQHMLVQVTKESIRGKGARLTTQVSLPGRFLVYLPFGSRTLAYSKRLGPSEKERLGELFSSVYEGDRGFIFRTAADGVGQQELEREIQRLEQQGSRLQEQAERCRPPALIHCELPLDLRLMRDLFNHEFSRCFVDDPVRYDAGRAYLEEADPRMLGRLQLYADEMPLFKKYNIDEALREALHRKVWLRSGGFICIDQTEALTAVDVNTGKYVGARSLEETALRTNLEAAQEIARQLRLRDIGGIIVIDFIDQRLASSRDRVFETFQQTLACDRTRTQVVEISKLGLLEMTRKKVAESLLDRLHEECSSCGGRGSVISAETAAITVRRFLRRLCERTPAEALLVKINPRVLELLALESDSSFVEPKSRKPIYMMADPGIDPDYAELVRVGSAEEMARLAAF